MLFPISRRRSIIVAISNVRMVDARSKFFRTQYFHRSESLLRPTSFQLLVNNACHWSDAGSLRAHRFICCGGGADLGRPGGVKQFRRGAIFTVIRVFGAGVLTGVCVRFGSFTWLLLVGAHGGAHFTHYYFGARCFLQDAMCVAAAYWIYGRMAEHVPIFREADFIDLRTACCAFRP